MCEPRLEDHPDAARHRLGAGLELASRRLGPTILVGHFIDSRGEPQFAELRTTLDPLLLSGTRGRLIRLNLEALLATLGAELLSLQLLAGDSSAPCTADRHDAAVELPAALPAELAVYGSGP